MNNVCMVGLGKRLRKRAMELGLSDAEVARRAGLTTTRYGHYVTDYREPDLVTLVRICRVIGMHPDALLEYDQSGDEHDEAAGLRQRIAGYAETMERPSLELASLMMQAIASSAELRSSGTIKPPQTEVDDIEISKMRTPRKTS